jgi:hypothetical protein
MEEGGIEKIDGFLVHGITQKSHLTFVGLFVTAKRIWKLNANSMWLPC